MTPRTVSYEFTEELALRYWKNTQGSFGCLFWPWVLVVFIGFLLATSLVSEFAGLIVLAFSAAATIAGIAFFAWANANAKCTFLASLAKLPHQKYVLTFSDNELIVHGPTGQSNRPWQILSGIYCYTDSWLLNFVGCESVMVPLETLDEPLRIILREKATERGVLLYRKKGLFMQSVYGDTG